MENDSIEQHKTYRKRFLQESGFASVLVELTLGVFIVGYALYFGASEFQIGILSALPFLFSSTQLFTNAIVQKVGSKKTTAVGFLGLARSFWVLLVILPFIPGARGSAWAPWVIILTPLCVTGFGHIGVVAWMSWVTDYVPIPIRGDFFTRRNLIVSICGGITLILGTYLLDQWAASFPSLEIYKHSVVMSIGLVSGLTSVFLLSRIPDTRTLRRNTDVDVWRNMVLPFKDKFFRKFLLTRCYWTVAMGMVVPFFHVFMLKYLGLSYWTIGLILMIGRLFDLYGMRFWGRMIDQFGSRPVLILSFVGKGIYPLLWLFLRPDNWWLLFIIISFNIFNTALLIGSSTLMLRLSPEKDRESYVAGFQASMNVCYALGALIGGIIAEQLEGMTFAILPFWTIYGIQFLFIIGALWRFSALFFIKHVQEPDQKGVSHMLKVLINLPGFYPFSGGRDVANFWLAPFSPEHWRKSSERSDARARRKK
jgi:MFS family permease